MEPKKAQIKYSDLMDLLNPNNVSGANTYDQLKGWEITVVDENGRQVGKFILGEDCV